MSTTLYLAAMFAIESFVATAVHNTLFETRRNFSDQIKQIKTIGLLSSKYHSKYN